MTIDWQVIALYDNDRLKSESAKWWTIDWQVMAAIWER